METLFWIVLIGAVVWVIFRGKRKSRGGGPSGGETFDAWDGGGDGGNGGNGNGE